MYRSYRVPFVPAFRRQMRERNIWGTRKGHPTPLNIQHKPTVMRTPSAKGSCGLPEFRFELWLSWAAVQQGLANFPTIICFDSGAVAYDTGCCRGFIPGMLTICTSRRNATKFDTMTSTRREYNNNDNEWAMYDPAM